MTDDVSTGGFLSTLSLRRATKKPNDNIQTGFDFYPRSPCGERLPDAVPVNGNEPDFYPRSPCGERLTACRATGGDNIFLSTLSLRRATEQYGLKWTCETDFYPRSPCGERPIYDREYTREELFLSTLSLRRATKDAIKWLRREEYFYPRSPCGERPRESASI